MLKKLNQELGICLYGEDDDTLESITGQLLIEKKMEEAEEDLKIEIQSYRRKIASIFLDSIQNYKNIMTIAEAEKLTRDAIELFPEHTQGDQILAGIYIDKGILNTNVGNYCFRLLKYPICSGMSIGTVHNFLDRFSLMTVSHG